MKQSQELHPTPTLKQRRDAVLRNIDSARRDPEASVGRYNNRFNLRQKAMYAGAAALVGVSAVAVHESLYSNAQIRPAHTQYILQPGETITEIASEQCKPSNHDAAVQFIVLQNHISDNQIGSLPSFTPLTVPDSKSC